MINMNLHLMMKSEMQKDTIKKKNDAMNTRRRIESNKKIRLKYLPRVLRTKY